MIEDVNLSTLPEDKLAEIRVDAIKRAVAAAIETRRTAIDADPTIGTLTLVVKFDGLAPARVIYRTESTERT